MARTVMLLRHAKSSWADPGLADFDRPLAPRGRRASKLVAEYLRKQQADPALVLCSTSARTRETLEAVLPALGDCEVEFEPRLYGASSGELLGRLREVPDSSESVLVVAHNPGLHDLALELAGDGPGVDRLREKFPTGALATFAVRRGGWASLGPGRAELVDYVVPRELE